MISYRGQDAVVEVTGLNVGGSALADRLGRFEKDYVSSQAEAH
jgi:hypothetical protein